MAILDARSPRSRLGGDRTPDTDSPSRTSPGGGPAPNPGGFAGPFDSPSESTSTTSSTRPGPTPGPSSTGVSPGGFGGGFDSASESSSTTSSTTSSPTPRPTPTEVSSGGSVSNSESKGGSSSGGSKGGGLPPATIIGIVAGAVLFVFLSSFVHFWSRGKQLVFPVACSRRSAGYALHQVTADRNRRKEALLRPPLTLPPRAGPLEEHQSHHGPRLHNLALEALPQVEGARRAEVL